MQEQKASTKNLKVGALPIKKLNYLMKNLIYILVILFSGVLLTTTSSCKREKEACHDPANPSCENYDPCYGQEPVTAKIEIGQYFPVADPEFANVSILEDKFIAGYIQFNCPVPNAKYTWVLGAETITSQKFSRSFSDALPKGTYTVKLIIEKEPNKSCFPADDGVDTLIKTFEFVPVCKTLTIGIFKGVWEGHSDSVLFSVRPVDYNNRNDSCNNSNYQFTNLWLTQDTIVKSSGDVYHTNTTLAVRTIGNLSISKLNMKVNSTTLETTLQYNAGTNGPFKKFKGRRIAD